MPRRRSRMLRKCGQRRRDAGMRRPLAARAPKRRGRWRRAARTLRASQQLLRQTRRLHLPELRGRGRAVGLCGARTFRAARGQSGDRGRHENTRSIRRFARRRRLLDPDLRDAACGRWLPVSRVLARRSASRRSASGGGEADQGGGRRPSGFRRGDRAASTRSIMETLGLRAFVKTGAEGVYCAAFPELGLGVAIKCAGRRRRAPRKPRWRRSSRDFCR